MLGVLCVLMCTLSAVLARHGASGLWRIWFSTVEFDEGGLKTRRILISIIASVDYGG